VFNEVFLGHKTFEIRFDDRGYREGDLLVLRETHYTGEEMRAGAPLEYTGRDCARIVTHVLRGPIYGLKEGWVIMSITSPAPTSAQPSQPLESSTVEEEAVPYRLDDYTRTASTDKDEREQVDRVAIEAVVKLGVAVPYLDEFTANGIWSIARAVLRLSSTVEAAERNVADHEYHIGRHHSVLARALDRIRALESTVEALEKRPVDVSWLRRQELEEHGAPNRSPTARNARTRNDLAEKSSTPDRASPESSTPQGERVEGWRPDWICEFCYRPVDGDLPPSWELVLGCGVCPDCHAKVFRDGGFHVVKGGAYAFARDPRPFAVRVLHEPPQEHQGGDSTDPRVSKELGKDSGTAVAGPALESTGEHTLASKQPDAGAPMMSAAPRPTTSEQPNVDLERSDASELAPSGEDALGRTRGEKGEDNTKPSRSTASSEQPKPCVRQEERQERANIARQLEGASAAFFGELADVTARLRSADGERTTRQPEPETGERIEGWTLEEIDRALYAAHRRWDTRNMASLSSLLEAELRATDTPLNEPRTSIESAPMPRGNADESATSPARATSTEQTEKLADELEADKHYLGGLYQPHADLQYLAVVIDHLDRAAAALRQEGNRGREERLPKADGGCEWCGSTLVPGEWDQSYKAGYQHGFNDGRHPRSPLPAKNPDEHTQKDAVERVRAVLVSRLGTPRWVYIGHQMEQVEITVDSYVDWTHSVAREIVAATADHGEVKTP